MSSAVDGPAGDAFVSTGELPERALVQSLVREAHDRYRANRDGENSQAYPALASVPADLFGVCVVGNRWRDGSPPVDADQEFTLMSVSKPFVFALMCGLVGASGRRGFGLVSTAPVCHSTHSGLLSGLQTAAPIRWSTPAQSPPPAWRRGTRSRIAGSSSRRDSRGSPVRELGLMTNVYVSASATNSRNQSIARLLESYGRLYCPVSDAVELYTRQCCLRVSARELSVIGATLADGGVNPADAESGLIDASLPPHTLSDADRRVLQDFRRMAL